MTLRLGCCITPHGFGHASRAAAVMEAVGKQAAIEWVVVTTVADWFFTASLSVPFCHIPLQTDVGMVQKSSLHEDLLKTVATLDNFYPLSETRIRQAVEAFAGCALILCDIAPLGIIAANRLGIPSLLLENFTWDWIYDGYLDQVPTLQAHVDYLQQIYARANHHLQTTPVCAPLPDIKPIPPIRREGKTSRESIRRQLRIAEDEHCVLITMGGVSGDAYAVQPLVSMAGYVFLLVGTDSSAAGSENIRLLSQNSGFYHPDLIAAADVVVGKVGYSTLAEVYGAGIPFGYIKREHFRESVALADFIRHEMAGVEIQADSFADGSWLQQLPKLTSLARRPAKKRNGAEVAAAYIIDLLKNLSLDLNPYPPNFWP